MSLQFARTSVTDDMVVAALGPHWLFVHQIVERVVGKQLKTVNPAFRTRLNRIAKEGRIEAEPDKIRGQERWRLPRDSSLT